MILQHSADHEGWYYFFENKEVYDELAEQDDYIKPGPEMLETLAEGLRKNPEQFEIQEGAATHYYHFRFRYLKPEQTDHSLLYRILYYPWDDEGYFYIVNDQVFEFKKTPCLLSANEQPFEQVPLQREKELLAQLDLFPGQFDITEGNPNDFFYKKFRFKSL